MKTLIERVDCVANWLFAIGLPLFLLMAALILWQEAAILAAVALN